MSERTALVTGSKSGLGKDILRELQRHGYNCVPWDSGSGPDSSGLRDVRSPDLALLPGRLNVLVNCAGVNRIDWAEDVTREDWDAVMDTNAWGMFRMSQACLPMLRQSRGTIVNIVSNAAHMPMRCSAAYNASKGAALILSKQMAREFAPDVTVFSLSPNKLSNTSMSRDIDRQVMQTRGWTRKAAQEYQLAGLLTGQETNPKVVAEFLGFLLSSKTRHASLTGCDIPYGA